MRWGEYFRAHYVRIIVVGVLLAVVGCAVSLPLWVPPDVPAPSFRDIYRQVFGNSLQWELAYFNGKVYQSQADSKIRGVLVLPLNAQMSEIRLEAVVERYLAYCTDHNYGLYARYTQDFAADQKPAKERLNNASLRMLRAALAVFPAAEWFWLLEDGLHRHLSSIPMPPLDPADNLWTSLLPRIQTSALGSEAFATDVSKLDIAVTTNRITGQISAKSIMVRNSLLAAAVLSIATDPLMQDYRPFVVSFDHSESIITHIMEWHPQSLSRIGVLPSSDMGISACADAYPPPLAC